MHTVFVARPSEEFLGKALWVQRPEAEQRSVEDDVPGRTKIRGLCSRSQQMRVCIHTLKLWREKR